MVFPTVIVPAAAILAVSFGGLLDCMKPRIGLHPFGRRGVAFLSGYVLVLMGRAEGGSWTWRA
jgi:hypothetical protein